MIRQIILYETMKNYEVIRVQYNLASDTVAMFTYYRDKNKHKKTVKQYQKTHRDEIYKQQREYKRKWRKTKKGKLIKKKSKTKRKRNLGFNKLFSNPFDESIKIHWHHVNNSDVVALPADIHMLYYCGKDVNKHREMLKPIIEQIYGVDKI